MWPFRWMMHRKRGLKMAIVSMLSSSPKNGVELMDEIERMTQGWWRPSPGSVYPLLERMADEGTIRKRDDGKYELTPKANAELEVSFGSRFRSPRTTEGLVSELQSLVLYAEDLAKVKPDEVAGQREKLRDLARRLDALAE